MMLLVGPAHFTCTCTLVINVDLESAGRVSFGQFEAILVIDIWFSKVKKIFLALVYWLFAVLCLHGIFKCCLHFLRQRGWIIGHNEPPSKFGAVSHYHSRVDLFANYFAILSID